MQITHPDQVGDYYKEVGNLRTGYQQIKTLLAGQENAPGNYKLSYEGGGDSEDWTTPRHRHNFDQFRHPLVGDYVINKDEILPAGWVAYFPESAYYGPQTKTANLEMITVQFGGSNGHGYWSVKQRKQGYEDLVAKGGVFKDGVYSWTGKDGRKNNQDAAEAVWEQGLGRKVTYSEPRYQNVLMINPASFDWIKDKSQSGVARKNLGDFTERHSRIGFIRIDKGASFKFGEHKAPEILFLKEGALSHQGKTYGKLTAFGRDPEDAPVTLTAAEPTEIWYAKLPTF